MDESYDYIFRWFRENKTEFEAITHHLKKPTDIETTDKIREMCLECEHQLPKFITDLRETECDIWPTLQMLVFTLQTVRITLDTSTQTLDSKKWPINVL